MGTGQRSPMSVNFYHGQRDYYLGGHPLWQVFRCAHQMTRRPYLFGGLSLMVGYAWAAIRRVKRPVSDELVQFHRAEQMARLGRFFRKVSARVGVGG